MNKREFEKVKGNTDKLLVLIFDDYKNSIDKESCNSLKDSLVTYVADAENYDSIFDCFRHALQEQLCYLFTDMVKNISLNIDQVLGELIEMDEDESRGIIVWQMLGEGAKYQKLLKIYNIQCDEVIDIYLKNFPELFTFMLKIEFYK